MLKNRVEKPGYGEMTGEWSTAAYSPDPEEHLKARKAGQARFSFRMRSWKECVVKGCRRLGRVFTRQQVPCSSGAWRTCKSPESVNWEVLSW